jgi:hypothetical protein
MADLEGAEAGGGSVHGGRSLSEDSLDGVVAGGACGGSGGGGDGDGDRGTSGRRQFERLAAHIEEVGELNSWAVF